MVVTRRAPLADPRTRPRATRSRPPPSRPGCAGCRRTGWRRSARGSPRSPRSCASSARSSAGPVGACGQLPVADQATSEPTGSAPARSGRRLASPSAPSSCSAAFASGCTTRGPPRSPPRPAPPRSRKPGGSRSSAPPPSDFPCCVRWSLRDADRVASTASPSAPPTCALVLTRPGGEAGVALGRAGHRDRHQRREADADPRPEQDHHRQDVQRRSSPSAGACVNSTSPAVDQREAREEQRPGAEARDQRLGVADRAGSP